MKKTMLTLVFSMSLALISVPSNASPDREYFNGKQFKMGRHGIIVPLRNDIYDDTIILYKTIDTPKDPTMKQSHDDAINFYYLFSKKYKFKNLDRDYIGYMVTNKSSEGVANDSMYKISLENLKKLNTRNFDATDMERVRTTDLPSIRGTLQNVKVINLRNNTIHNERTRGFKRALNNYEAFGAIEHVVENPSTWRTPRTNSSSSTGVKKITSAGTNSYSVKCNDGSDGVISIVGKTGVYRKNGTSYPINMYEDSIESIANKICN